MAFRRDKEVGEWKCKYLVTHQAGYAYEHLEEPGRATVKVLTYTERCPDSPNPRNTAATIAMKWMNKWQVQRMQRLWNGKDAA